MSFGDIIGPRHHHIYIEAGKTKWSSPLNLMKPVYMQLGETKCGTKQYLDAEGEWGPKQYLDSEGEFSMQVRETKWGPRQYLGAGEEILTIYKEYNGQEIEVARVEINLSQDPNDIDPSDIDHYSTNNIYIKKTLNNSGDEPTIININSPHRFEDLVRGEDNEPAYIHLGNASFYTEDGEGNTDWYDADNIWIKDDGVYVKILGGMKQIMAFDDLSSMPQLDFL